MKKILFVCLGNICRSPMAEFVMKDFVQKAGRAEEFFISSAATCDWEIGNPIYPPAKEILVKNGIAVEEHIARQIQKEEYEEWDLIIGMDDRNMNDLRTLFDGDPQGKIHLLMEYGKEVRAVADPYFTKDFKACWDDIVEGCNGLLNSL